MKFFRTFSTPTSSNKSNSFKIPPIITPEPEPLLSPDNNETVVAQSATPQPLKIHLETSLSNSDDFGHSSPSPLEEVELVYEDDLDEPEIPATNEPFAQLVKRQTQNIIHFFVEDWFISAMLGVITAMLSILVDVSYEYLNHYRAMLFDYARSQDKLFGFVSWVGYLVVFVTAAALTCKYISVQAVGSGIPEVKVIMHGFKLKNYLSFRTLVAKILSLILTLGSGLPVGKEGPFVHMGAIVGTLLSKMTKVWQSNAFFSNEGREMEILTSGCSVGIACTFSSPAGAVLYGIESTHRYFPVKNYWRAFFATTCSALIFRFANWVITDPEIAGTITAYYQTSFPTEAFLVEEIPVFMLLGALCGLLGASFVMIHKRIAIFAKQNRTVRAIFLNSDIAFTVFMAFVVAVVTYPDGFGEYIAGKFTFRETLIDFISNCTMSLHNISSSMGCRREIIERWDANYGNNSWKETAISDGLIVMPNIVPKLLGYIVINYFLVAICISLAIPAGVFVPSFVIGACGGRIVGELMVILFPEGIRGLTGPQIYPGLYAVVGAAAYTGAVTHSLSIAVIVCETTGQLSPLLPVLVALMVANAIASFLQPSIYESIIILKKYPHLAELPPSRVSVHTLMVEQIMVKNVIFITKQTTYQQLRELLIATPQLRSYPLVTDKEERILLGSVARKYLSFLLSSHLGPDPLLDRSRSQKFRNRKDFISIISRQNSLEDVEPQFRKVSLLNERNMCGNMLLSISPLHEEHNPRNSPLMPLLRRQNTPIYKRKSAYERTQKLCKTIALDEVAIDPAPFQLVQGTSLYKVHTLFSLLGLNHAYVTHRGKLIGVVALRELRGALANIYTRGAVPFVDHQISKKRSLPGIIESHPVHSKNGSTSNIGPLTQTTTADSSADNMKDSLRISRSNSTGRQLFESDSSSDDTENDNPFLETPNVLSED